MVDFQERDTRRGLGDDGNGDPDEDEHHGHGEDHDHGTEHDHDHHAHDLEAVGAAVVTISSTRTLEDDPSGDAIVDAFEAAGHAVEARELVGDDHDRIQRVVEVAAGRGDVDVVVTTGGTGITPDDVTVEALRPLLDKRLPGFGELFRRASFEEIGTRVIATRATAGIRNGTPVFCLPGSESAVRLGTEEIIVPEVGHLAGLARRGHAGEDEE